MELFYSKNIAEGETSLDRQESNHCINVLRHRKGDFINVIDGQSRLFKCTVVDDNPKCVRFSIDEVVEGYGSHPYRLHMAVAPPKNIDRFEWFAEKATEIGVDEITPLFWEYSERKIFKPERVERILVSASKQSHKGSIPVLHPAVSVKDFISGQAGTGALKLICYCDDVAGLGVEKIAIAESLHASPDADIIVMIGPEGDFSRSEVETAVAGGWIVTSLGKSRLRIETAAVVATAAVYLEKSR